MLKYKISLLLTRYCSYLERETTCNANLLLQVRELQIANTVLFTLRNVIYYGYSV